LGRLEVSFDANGKVLTGTNKSALVAGTLIEDAALKQKITDYYAPVKAQNDVVIGTSTITFSGARGTASSFVAGVRNGETLVGNLVSDLMETNQRRGVVQHCCWQLDRQNRFNPQAHGLGLNYPLSNRP